MQRKKRSAEREKIYDTAIAYISIHLVTLTFISCSTQMQMQMQMQMQGPPPQIQLDQTSNDDFLKQMLSNLPPSSFWDPHDHSASALMPLSFHQTLYNINASPQPPNPHTHTFGPSAPPKHKVRARRGQATDPHSIAERLRRERIAERMKALQELVPNANKTDKASMLDEIIDYVKFLQLQVKVLSMSRLGGAAAVAPVVGEMSSEGGKVKGNEASSNDSLAMTEQQVAKLMEEDMGSAMQYLQGKGLCLMPISLATAISNATSRTFINAHAPPTSPGPNS